MCLNKKLLYFICFFAGFAAVSAVLLHTDELQRDHSLSFKRELFQENADKWTSIFLGDSGVLHHIDPVEFDRLLGAEGIESFSFNYGLQGMSCYEGLYLFKNILKEHALNLKTVFLSESFFYHRFENLDDYRVYRNVYWRDLDNMQHRITDVITDYKTWGWQQKLKSASSAVALTIHHYAGRGRFQYLFSGEESQNLLNEDATRVQQGFLDASQVRYNKQEQNPQQVKAAIEKRLEERRQKKDFRTALSNESFAERELIWEEILGLAMSRGIKVVLIGDLRPEVLPPLSCTEASGCRRIDFRQNVISELSEAKYFHDVNHLNRDGAAVFTKRLAKDYLKISNEGSHGL